jgi:hypothetical protein
MRRTLGWTLLLPLTASGVLAAHAAAYTLVGAPSEGVHDYLGHAPQALAVVVTLALVALALASRAQTPAAWPAPVLALGAFACQEHVERLLHEGHVPFLLDRPVFLVGLVLQLPVALAAWLVVRALVRAVSPAPARRRPPRLPRLALALPVPAAAPLPARPVTTARGRAPPHSRSR